MNVEINLELIDEVLRRKYDGADRILDLTIHNGQPMYLLYVEGVHINEEYSNILDMWTAICKQIEIENATKINDPKNMDISWMERAYRMEG